MIRTLVIDDEQPARERLKQLLSAHADVEVIEAVRNGSAATICSTILDMIRTYRGSRQDQDDVTVLVVKAS